jgi:hypothetical protein
MIKLKSSTSSNALESGLTADASGGHGSVANATTGDEYLTELQAARLLKLSQRTLQRWRHDGGGVPYIRISTRRITYRRADLIQWANARRFLNTFQEAAHAPAA